MNAKNKILLFDIETAPNLAYVWGKYEQDVIDYRKEWYVLSFSYKWLGEKSVHAHSLPEYSIYKKDKTNDLSLIKDLWKLFNEAEIIIAHNGDAFDIRKSNARFIFHKLTPPAPYRTIDTKKIAKRHFNFNSNKLDDLAKLFGFGEKIETRFDLWLGCMAGNLKDWNKMVRYNKHDVELLEKIYLKLLPWTTNHPNMGVYTEHSVCPKCSSKNISKRGFAFTKSISYQRYRCNDCGGWLRGNKNVRKNKPFLSL